MTRIGLPEQELWPSVQKELPPGVILDQGLPKPRGEVLLQAKCFAPRGEFTRAAQVSFRLGHLAKELMVFGPRVWERNTLGLQVRQGPKPFKQVDIGYENAFGGPGFAFNPIGKGLARKLSRAGREIVYLPQVENPGHLITSPDDRPAPAGFGPYDPAWPQRARKLGTYDTSG
jgi:hypothetical protein